MSRLSDIIRVMLLISAASAVGASLLEVRLPRGIDFVLQNSPTAQKYLIETMPGGVALLDYNNDGLLDIFLVNGGRIESPLSSPEDFDRHDPRYWNRLYRQNRDGTFTDVTAEAGLANAGDGNYGMGVAVGDYDNDGNPDLYVTSYGKNILYGRLDLFVTRYMEWDAKHSKDCGGNYHTYCPPGEFPRTTNILYHNRGDGTFEDVSERSGIAAKKGHGLGVAFADYNGDGWTDIYVANDGMQQYLFRNNGNGTFKEVGMEAGAALNVDGGPLSGMGVVFQDYDNDGRPDVIVTTLPRQTYAVFHNDGDGTFSDRGLQTGVTMLSGVTSGWGVGLEDFDNDGQKDLFVTQGHVLDNVEKIDPSLHYLEPTLLALNHNSRFERADPGTEALVAGRGTAFGDLNNDGSIDAVTTILGDHPQIFMNRGGTGHWLTITLRGARSNRDGLGARVQVNGQTRFATTAGSYESASDKRLHFGLGAAKSAKIEVLWPSGSRQILNDVPADQFLEVREPERP